MNTLQSPSLPRFQGRVVIAPHLKSDVLNDARRVTRSAAKKELPPDIELRYGVTHVPNYFHNGHGTGCSTQTIDVVRVQKTGWWPFRKTTVTADLGTYQAQKGSCFDASRPDERPYQFISRVIYDVAEKLRIEASRTNSSTCGG